MTSGRSVDGVMKWVAREEWRPAFEDVLDEHFGRACEMADVDLDGLASLVGSDWLMTLLGCALEDFMSRDLDDGRNVVDDYLKRRGWKESAINKAYLAGLRSSVMSLYEDSEIVPGKSFLARDLIRGGDPIRITEHTATRSLKQWDRIAARVVATRQKTVIGGGLLPFDHEMSETIVGIVNEVAAEAREEAPELMRRLGHEIDESTLADVAGVDAALRSAASAFTIVWLDRVLQTALQPTSPVVCNSDGEELLFSTVRYPLKPGTTESDVQAAVAEIPVLRQASETFWNWIGGRPPAAKAAGEERRIRTFVTKTDDGAVVLGNLKLEEGALTLSVNSQSRVERGRALLEPALAGLVGEPLVESQTLEEALAEDSGEDADPVDPNLPPEERRAIIHETMDRHYMNTLEEPLPALGGISPMEAAKTAEGRKKLVDWLKLLENHSAKQPADDALSDYDFTWMWEKLGVAHLRR